MKIPDAGERVDVVSIQRPKAYLSTFLLCLNRGSLDEAVNERGFLHFTEHMVFRSAPRVSRTGRVEILENLGAFVSGRTSLDTTEFVLRIDSRNALKGLRLFCGMVFGSRFTAKEFALEKKVILEEVRLDSQSFSARASRVVLEHLFGSGCSAQVTASEVEVEDLELAEISSFYKKTYVAGNFVLAHVGPHAHSAVTEVLDSVCHPGQSTLKQVFMPLPKGPRHVTIQAPSGFNPTILFAYRANGYATPDFFILDALCRVLGRKLAASAKMLGVERIELSLKPLLRSSIVEITIQMGPSDHGDSSEIRAAVEQQIALATIGESELVRGFRRAILEQAAERDSQDGLTRQLLRFKLGQGPATPEKIAQAVEMNSSFVLDRVRALGFRNPIVVSSY